MTLQQRAWTVVREARPPLPAPGRREAARAIRMAPQFGLAATVALVYLRFLDADFVGTDSLPAVQSNRLEGWSDLVAFWTQPLMAGSDFVVSQALFYRPIASLSFAFDAGVWGVNPVGYHLTNTLLQVTTTLLAFAVLRALRLSRGAAVLGAALLAFHPTMVAAVPVIARRYDVLSAALLFGALALLCRGGGVWTRTTSVALFAASLLAKESAFGALVLLPFLLYAARYVRHRWTNEHPLVYVRALTPYVLVAGLIFVVRYAILGGLGGHHDVDVLSLNFEDYRVMLDRYVFFLFWPFRHTYPEHTLGWAVLVLVVVVAVAVALTQLQKSSRVLVGLGLLWTAGFGAFFVLLHHLAGPWYLYYPLLGVGLVVAASADAAWTAVQGRALRRERLASAALAAVALVYTAATLAGSPLVRPDDQWQVAGQIMHRYLSGIQKCTEGLPSDTSVTLWNAPRMFDDGSEESSLLLASMIEGFTYDAYIRLFRPGQHFKLFIGQPVTYRSLPADLEVSCGWGGPNLRRVIATSSELPAPAFPTG